ncbi:hypothetical protein [Streptomyces venezuelae]|uniref:hypothetical protein n=1 Tax=Streptomyces venezuelae TaxID=54571 RepID=UPI0034183A51
MPVLQTMDREALYDLAGWCETEADSRIMGELLDALRVLTATEPVARIEFVTDPNYDDGVYWDDEVFYLHRADGTVEPFVFPEDSDAGYEEADERFRELLADYSRQDPPIHGAHLIVDLVSGEFSESGRYSLI